MVRPAVVLTLAAAAALASGAPRAEGEDKKSGSWVSPELLRKGLGLIPRVGLVSADVDFRPTANVDFRPAVQVGPVSLFGPAVANAGPSKSDLEELQRRQQEVDARAAAERNQVERDKLEVLRRQLGVQVEQAQAARDQAASARGAFLYQQEKDESLLRRLRYSLRPDKLVVVVADFSDGGTGEGVQVADEIANALTELRARCGVDFEVLVGEVKPGVVIRSEHLARDVGRHLPKGSGYAVVWGTLSPRTVGKFRPHVTCVMKTSDAGGVSSTYSVDLAAQDLPLGKDDEAARRARHEELVAFTCAVVPGCYAAYELSRERVPDLARLAAYLGKGPEADRFEKDLAPLRKWPEARRNGLEHLTRVSRVGPGAVAVNGRAVEADVEYPQAVLNTKDGSVMTLVTEPASHKPMQFDDPGGAGKYVAYVDTTEVTWRQFVPFFNATPADRRAGGGQPWLKVDPDFRNVKLDDAGRLPGDRLETIVPANDDGQPVFNVTYHGAVAYCRWAGKDLPRKAEWQAAARGAGAKYPWGDSFDNPEQLCVNRRLATPPFPARAVGSFAGTDRSAVGCLDVAGNVAEWCDDLVDSREGTRAVCGGSFEDADPADFDTTRHRAKYQSTHYRWVGFRGVVRVPIAKTGP